MHIIIITDIFGLTTDVDALAASLSTELMSVTVIDPCEEKHFDVDSIISGLSPLTQVHCIKTSYYHGFMNSLSENYAFAGATFFNDKMSNSHELHNVNLLR